MKLKKLITILMTMIVILSNIMGVNVSKAYTGERYKIQTNAEFNDVLSYDGTGARFIYCFYINEQGEEQPVYCIDKDVPGVESTNEKSYMVTASGKVADERVWRILHRSYPYVKITDMGCDNKYQCYIATKAALDCVLDNKDPNKYEALRAEGEPVISAIKTLVNYANDKSVIPYSADIELKATNEWKLEEINKKIYLSRTFEATNPYMKQNYTVGLRDYVPIGSLIVDINNVEKREFVPGEQFKILIPREEVTQERTLKIDVNANISTFPIYRGLPDGEYQIYALTGIETEKGYGSIDVKYKPIGGTMIINKIDSHTNEKLRGAIFRISDTKGNIITETNATPLNGQVKVFNLMEGRYFVEELKAPDGYKKITGRMLIPVYNNSMSYFNVMNTKTEIIEEEVHNVVVQVVENSTQTTTKTENDYYIYETNNNTENNIEINNTNIERETNNNIVNDTQNNNTIIEKTTNDIQNNNTTTSETKITNNTTEKTTNEVQNNNTIIEKTTKVENNQIQNNINTGKKLPKTGM